MMERRTGLMVAYDILQEARGGSLKTRLVYRCNLNFNIIKTWLSRLEAREMLEHSEESRTWTTTSRGIAFLLAMDVVKGVWDPPQGDTPASPEVVINA